MFSSSYETYTSESWVYKVKILVERLPVQSAYNLSDLFGSDIELEFKLVLVDLLTLSSVHCNIICVTH